MHARALFENTAVIIKDVVTCKGIKQKSDNKNCRFTNPPIIRNKFKTEDRLQVLP